MNTQWTRTPVPPSSMRSKLRSLRGSVPTDSPLMYVPFLLPKVGDPIALGIAANPRVLPGDAGLVQDDVVKPESTEGGRRVSVLRRQEGAPVLLG